MKHYYLLHIKNFSIYFLIILFSNTILRILIHDNLIGLIIGEEGNTIRNIMCVTETKINVTR